MNWQPTISIAVAKKRANIIDQIRHFFKERDVLEVDTPALSQSTITDVYIEAFKCRYNYLSSDTAVPLYLQTSPEFAMKRLLAAGFGDIFQIGKAFRHEAFGRYHNPEFTLLEWYRLGYDHFQLMDEVAELLISILNCPQPEKITYQNIFIKHVNIDPLATSQQALLDLLDKENKLSDWIIQENDLDLCLQLVFSELIEINIGKSKPCFVYDFPKTQASLAKISPIDPRVAERFECYFKGIELANGFNELTNADIQRSRFDNDNLIRVNKGLEEKTIDENFIAALQSGLPDCAGVALGIDRLIMLACDVEQISEVITFPIQNA